MRRFMQIATNDVLEFKNGRYRWVRIGGVWINYNWNDGVDLSWLEKNDEYVEISIKHYYGRIQKIWW